MTTSTEMTVEVTNKDFNYTIKFLKKNGYVFNGSSKTWTGTKDISFLINEGYVREITWK